MPGATVRENQSSPMKTDTKSDTKLLQKGWGAVSLSRLRFNESPHRSYLFNFFNHLTALTHAPFNRPGNIYILYSAPQRKSGHFRTFPDEKLGGGVHFLQRLNDSTNHESRFTIQ